MEMTTIKMLIKHALIGMGGGMGWIIGVFAPTFPLAVVAVLFILTDAWTAWQLHKRVEKRYPGRTTGDGKFTSFAFGKVIKSTIPKRLWLILLAYMAERWVFGISLFSLSYIVTGAVVFEQALSMLENESSCRKPSEGRLWSALRHMLIDKTERHLSISLEEFRNYDRITEEQVEEARETLRKWEIEKEEKKENESD